MRLVDLDVHHIHLDDLKVEFHNNMDCKKMDDEGIVFFSDAGREDFAKHKEAIRLLKGSA